ncbi:MAG: ABC transporter ATP-binding protein [Chitinophagales bacterium]|nr:ABC transporter ATP-binding protein [Chitinophagales bacterium]
MIEIKQLTHDYKQHRALYDVNVQIKENEITAIVGPNGAGKTTLLNNICGLLKPSYGNILIDGIDVYQSPREAHQLIGFLPDFFGLYNTLTVKDHLQYAAASHGMDINIIPAAIKETLEYIQLEDKINEKAINLSRGMRQRLAIGQVIIYKPKYIILDEPASGLDPEARLHLSKLFINLKNSGITIIVSSHILAELEEYATDLIVIRNGTIYQSKNEIAESTHIVTSLCNIVVRANCEQQTLEQTIKQYSNEITCSIINNQLTILFSTNENEQAKLLQFLANANIGLYHFEIKEKKMQDKYFESLNPIQ